MSGQAKSGKLASLYGDKSGYERVRYRTLQFDLVFLSLLTNVCPALLSRSFWIMDVMCIFIWWNPIWLVKCLTCGVSIWLVIFPSRISVWRISVRISKRWVVNWTYETFRSVVFKAFQCFINLCTPFVVSFVDKVPYLHCLAYILLRLQFIEDTWWRKVGVSSLRLLQKRSMLIFRPMWSFFVAVNFCIFDGLLKYTLMSSIALVLANSQLICDNGNIWQNGIAKIDDTSMLKLTQK